MIRLMTGLLLLLSIPALAADLPVAVVADGPAAVAAEGLQRVLMRHFDGQPSPVPCWPLVELYGPLPDTTGKDLLVTHSDWLALAADGQTRLPQTPCYGLPEVRAARVAQVAALAKLGAGGVCLSALPRSDWPAQTNIPRSFGFNPPLIAQFQARHGRDPAAAPAEGLDRALFDGLQAQALGELLRTIRQQAPGLKVALACAQADLLPHTATGAALDVPGYLKQGLLDEVMMRSDTPVNLNSLKLQTDAPLPVWAWCEADSGNALRPRLMTALRSAGVDGVVLQAPGSPAELAGLVQHVMAAYRAQQAQQAGLEQAIKDGKLKQVAGCEVGDKPDHATVHGVAQGFTVAEATEVSAVGLLLALRGPGSSALPPLVVTIRADDGGKPAAETLASVSIPPEGLSAEPGYRWTYVRLDRPVTLQPGTPYWLHAADPENPAGNYMWRLRKGGGYDGGAAWSRKYDYSANDWAFAIYSGDLSQLAGE